jgi:hypothetical protein
VSSYHNGVKETKEYPCGETDITVGNYESIQYLIDWMCNKCVSIDFQSKSWDKPERGDGYFATMATRWSNNSSIIISFNPLPNSILQTFYPGPAHFLFSTQLPDVLILQDPFFGILVQGQAFWEGNVLFRLYLRLLFTFMTEVSWIWMNLILDWKLHIRMILWNVLSFI